MKRAPFPISSLIALTFLLPALGGCGGGGLGGGDGLLGGIFGGDQDSYRVPVIQILSSDRISPAGEFVFKAAVTRPDTPIVSWSVKAKVYCGPTLCEDGTAFDGAFKDNVREFGFEHTFSDQVTRAEFLIEVAHLEKPGDERQLKLTEQWQASIASVKTPGEGEHIVVTPDEIDDLPIDAQGHLDGSLILESVYGLEDLARLDHIKSIGGDLRILSNPDLGTLSGMTSLEVIEGSLELANNWNVTDFATFPALTSITGSLTIRGAHADADLRAFPALERVNALELDATRQLERVSGFDSLRTLDTLDVELNENLTTLDLSFDADGAFTLVHLEHNSALEALLLPTNYTQAQVVEVIRHSALPNLRGLGSLRDIGTLIIKNNHRIPNLDGLSNLDSVLILHIEHNHNLESLEGADALEQVDAQVIIKRNHSLPTCAATAFANRVHPPSREIARNDDDSTCGK